MCNIRSNNEICFVLVSVLAGGVDLTNSYKIEFTIESESSVNKYSLKDYLLMRTKDELITLKVGRKDNLTLQETVALEGGEKYELYFTEEDPLCLRIPQFISGGTLNEKSLNRKGFIITCESGSREIMRLGATLQNFTLYASMAETLLSDFEVWEIDFDEIRSNSYEYIIRNKESKRMLAVGATKSFEWAATNSAVGGSRWILRTNSNGSNDEHECATIMHAQYEEALQISNNSLSPRLKEIELRGTDLVVEFWNCR